MHKTCCAASPIIVSTYFAIVFLASFRGLGWKIVKALLKIFNLMGWVCLYDLVIQVSREVMNGFQLTVLPLYYPSLSSFRVQCWGNSARHCWQRHSGSLWADPYTADLIPGTSSTTRRRSHCHPGVYIWAHCCRFGYRYIPPWEASVKSLLSKPLWP